MTGSVRKEFKRTMELLEEKIKETRGTYREVEKELSWGRSYISGMFRGSKEVRLDQVLLILGAIGIKPSDFYCELYGIHQEVHGKHAGDTESKSGYRCGAVGGTRKMVATLQIIVRCLVEKNLITVEELTKYVEEEKPRDLISLDAIRELIQPSKPKATE